MVKRSEWFLLSLRAFQCRITLLSCSLKLSNIDHLDSEWRLCSKTCDELSVNKNSRTTLVLFSCDCWYQLRFQAFAKEIFTCFGLYFL
jgi:hypothetical protein